MIDDLKSVLPAVESVESFETLVQSAQSYEADDNPTQAKQLYLKALELEPNSPAVNHALGIIECQLGSVEQAIPRFKTSIQFDADNEQYWVTYFDALVAIGDLEAAKTALDYGVQYGLQTSTARVLASEHNIALNNEEQVSLIRLPKLGPVSLDNVKTFKSNNYWCVSDRERFQTLMTEAVTYTHLTLPTILRVCASWLHFFLTNKIIR